VVSYSAGFEGGGGLQVFEFEVDVACWGLVGGSLAAMEEEGLDAGYVPACFSGESCGSDTRCFDPGF
jgi:hypothetical protein